MPSAWAPRSFTRSRKALKDAGHNTGIGDEGGFAPALKSADEALTFIMKSIEKAGYKPGDDVVLALDCASTEFFKGGKYELAGEGKSLDSAGMAKYLEDLVKRFPIISIEDGMAEDDWAGWKALTDLIGKRCQLVGDDLFVTNTERLAQGIKTSTANSILVKVNQIGSLTETLDAVSMAQRAGYTAVMSHRSGETEDFDHCRSRGRDQLRADQDGLAVALRPSCQVQPAHPHRGRARRCGALRR